MMNFHLPITIEVLLAAGLLYVSIVDRHFRKLRKDADTSWHELQSILHSRYVLGAEFSHRIVPDKALKECRKKILKASQCGMNATTLVEHESADALLRYALNDCIDRSKRSPQWQSDPKCTEFSKRWEQSESAIRSAKRRYNFIVMQYNERLNGHPDALVAHLLHHTPLPFFDAPDRDESVPHRIPEIDFAFV